MRSLVLPLVALMVAATPAVAQRVSGEERLAKAVEGRVAGEPVDCINLRAVRSSQVIDRTAIVYDAGGTIYVNRPRSGVESLRSWDALISRTHSSQLCSIDVLQTYDTGARMRTGAVFLGEFVPYRRADAVR